MTKRSGSAFLLMLLLLPMTSAHPSPDPRTFETRLLADCVDDQGHAISTGYDLHSLDVWEFWDDQEMVGFRLILNGDGDATITLSFDQDGASQQFSWNASDGEWTGNGFAHVEQRDDVEDGDRFALIGHVPYDELGGEGATLSDFAVETSQAITGNDEMPGAGPANPDCTPDGANKTPYERPDYTIGEKSVDGAYLSKVPDDMAVDLLADEERFIDVTMVNRIDSLKQQVTLDVIETTGDVAVDFHEPGGDYAKTVEVELNSRTNSGSERLIHLALNAPEGASGSVTIRLTTEVVLKDGSTQPGGHMVRTFDYTVPEDGPGMDPDPMETNNEDEGTKDTPSPAVVLASMALLGAAAWRRR